MESAKAISQLNIRRQNFHSLLKICENCETFLLLNFFNLWYLSQSKHSPICKHDKGLSKLNHTKIYREYITKASIEIEILCFL